MGLDDLGINQKQLRNLSDMIQRGEGDSVTAHLEMLAKNKGEEFYSKLKERRHVLQETIDLGAGGLDAEEQKTLAGRAGSAAAQKLRMEGAQQDRTATSELQQKILTTMERQLKVQTASLLNDSKMIAAIKEQAKKDLEKAGNE
jgi:hypothetical protein